MSARDVTRIGQEITFEEDRRESNSRAFVVWGEVSWSADIPSGFVFGVAETQDGEHDLPMCDRKTDIFGYAFASRTQPIYQP